MSAETRPPLQQEASLSRHGKPEAAALVWGLTHEAQPRKTLAEQTRDARKRGCFQALGAGFFSGVFFYVGWNLPGMIAGGISAFTLFAALFSPTGLFAGIERIINWTAQKVGIAASWILLVPLFYLFFLPFGKLFRRGAKDRLKRSFDTEADSYWNVRDEAGHDHERQF